MFLKHEVFALSAKPLDTRVPRTDAGWNTADSEGERLVSVGNREIVEKNTPGRVRSRVGEAADVILRRLEPRGTV